MEAHRAYGSTEIKSMLRARGLRLAPSTIQARNGLAYARLSSGYQWVSLLAIYAAEADSLRSTVLFFPRPSFPQLFSLREI